MHLIPIWRDFAHFKSLRRQNELLLWLNHWTKEKSFVIWRNRTACISLHCGWQLTALKNMFLSSQKTTSCISRGIKTTCNESSCNQVSLTSEEQETYSKFWQLPFYLCLFLMTENPLRFLTSFLELYNKERCPELFFLSYPTTLKF